MQLEGTDFQIAVWKELLKIPAGQTKTYKEIAVAIGKPNSSRAVAKKTNIAADGVCGCCHATFGHFGRQKS